LFISLLHERLRGQVGDRKRAERQLQEYARHLQILNRRLIESQEAERRRLSRELHDEIGQTLTAIKVDIHAARRLPKDESEARLDDAISMVDGALERVRSLSLDLRPSLLDDLGLAPALRWYVDRLSQRASFTVSMTASDFQRRLPSELETTCFRVVQEAVTNVIRHAQASHVDIELQIEEDEVLLTVRDNGTGFDVIAARGQGQRNFNLGLVGMQERVELLGGQLSILSQFGEGTELTARFDLSSSVLTQKDVAQP
jgi:signal transduction histidine kinase